MRADEAGLAAGGLDAIAIELVFEDLDGVYLVGGGTHPGSGLPVIFQSALITSRLMMEDLGVRAIPRALHNEEPAFAEAM